MSNATRGVHDSALKQVLRRARKAGCAVEWTRGNHIKITPPYGRPVFTSGTPGDHRSTANLIQQLRKNGVRL